MFSICLSLTNLGSDSFPQVNGVFQPLLASRGGRVHGAGAQVGISWCWGTSGRRRAWPGDLGTLLLGNRVLKHTLINWGWRGDKDREVNTQKMRRTFLWLQSWPCQWDVCCENEMQTFSSWREMTKNISLQCNKAGCSTCSALPNAKLLLFYQLPCFWNCWELLI